MESAKHALVLILHGAKDCFSGIIITLKEFLCAQELSRQNVERSSVTYSNRQDSVRSKLFQCCVFGLFYWISNLLFNRFFLQYAFIQMVELTGEDLNESGVIWIQNFLYYLFCALWIFPLLILSKLLNFIWYQDIADVVLTRMGVQKNSNIKISDFYADLVKSFILQGFYWLQGYVVYFLPLPVIIQDLWFLFHCALLSSLYAFEYRWVHMGWLLHKRLLNIHRKWPYYLGFGLPLALVTTYASSSSIDGMILYSALFPMYVISSSVTYNSQSPVFSHPFRIFKVADFMSDMLILCIPFLKRVCTFLLLSA